ncbi:hypothetical protein HYPSUDRAFT_209873 [Hypholoma sublateritium FD-334 SS-4]|uniref:Secreted protein n=1 Tax=Hypholoma sublateritium (strain FD-334 SS-4) TaxID=945553 RepID=A0A0D2LQE8_HYPSF|nr:hypothetical protein HYPSUDRAFT_209873 [Hypholoma sublateritium FD-334 SS-4]
MRHGLNKTVNAMPALLTFFELLSATSLMRSGCQHTPVFPRPPMGGLSHHGRASGPAVLVAANTRNRRVYSTRASALGSVASPHLVFDKLHRVSPPAIHWLWDAHRPLFEADSACEIVRAFLTKVYELPARMPLDFGTPFEARRAPLRHHKSRTTNRRSSYISNNVILGLEYAGNSFRKSAKHRILKFTLAKAPSVKVTGTLVHQRDERRTSDLSAGA